MKYNNKIKPGLNIIWIILNINLMLNYNTKGSVNDKC